MTWTSALLGAVVCAATTQPTAAQGPSNAGAAAAAAQPTRFAGTWVGTQAWAVADPPPGARSDQPVTLTIEVVDGKVMGSMKPFLGGEDGATFVDAVIIGEELRVKAVVGRPRQGPPPAGAAVEVDPEAADAPPAGRAGRAAPPGWKDPIAVAFVFSNDGVRMKGTADVKMGEVPWLKFAYDLSRKRSRY